MGGQSRQKLEESCSADREEGRARARLPGARLFTIMSEP